METLRLCFVRHDLVLGLVPNLLLLAGCGFPLWRMRVPRRGAYKDNSGLVFQAFPYNFIFLFMYLPYGFCEFLKRLSEGWATRQFGWMMWCDLLLVVLLGLGAVLSAPGTIVLEPDGIRQRFWLLKDRCIRYCDVDRIVSQFGGVTVKPHSGRSISLTDTQGFPDRALFEEEITQRVGQSTVGIQ